MSRIVRTLLIAAALMVASPGHAQSPAAQKLLTAIAPQSLDTALKNWAKQSGIQVMYSTSVAHGRNSNGATAGVSNDEALKQILAGTGLTYRVLNDRTVSVVSHESAETGVPADQMRVADAFKEPSSSNSASAAEDTEKDQVVVQDTRVKPYMDRNADIPRTVNDAQPYYIFDAKTIEQSGAANIDDFLKRRLTMNTNQSSNSQIHDPTHSSGNISKIDLRGLGTSETLVLVNGRRIAGVNASAGLSTIVYGQPDINGIPLSAIDRIEVLPSSSSGIYGGSALGGIVNVILKDDFSGGELKPRYNNTFDSDAPNRSVEGSFGTSLEQGRTHVMVTGQYSDSKPLMVADRRQLLDRGYARIQENSPGFFGLGGTSPVLGSAVNIASADGADLVLKGGSSLGTPIATLPEGYAFTTLPAMVSALIPGQWNLALPAVNERPNGLTVPLAPSTRTKSLLARVTRRFTDGIEAYADYSHLVNQTSTHFTNFSSAGGISVFASAPNNPFNQDVNVSFPIDLPFQNDTQATTNSATVGLNVQLPLGWTGMIDYQWSKSAYNTGYAYTGAYFPLYQPIWEGQLNVFDQSVPTLDAIRQNILGSYYGVSFMSKTTLNDLNLRASGPLLRLPWGTPTLSLALEHRKEGSPGNTSPVNEENGGVYGTYIQTLYGQSQSVLGGYAELNVPLITDRNRIPMVRLFDVQLAARHDGYTVGSGTYGFTVYPQVPDLMYYMGPTRDGQPYRDENSYSTTHTTFGLRYEPLKNVMVRASYATAFLPPTYDQLLLNTEVNATGARVTDPQNPGAGRYSVATINGGSPDLLPQTSSSVLAGIVWRPGGALDGLRLDIEYTDIEQKNAIASLSAQVLVDNESTYADRIVRDSGGRITSINTRLMNLFKYESSYVDLSLGYRRDTPAGAFDVSALFTVNQHLKRQLAVNAPQLDLVDYPNEGGVAREKGNVTLSWQPRNMTLSWTTQYSGSYRQVGASGDPQGVWGYYTSAQGANSIPAFVTHDVFFQYDFGRRQTVLSNFTVQAGVINLFDRMPPFDVYNTPFYYSYYGDIRLRQFWFSLKKAW